MNWDAVGAVAELAGALGVIASLAYLAVQIRQNTAQMERSARAARGAAYQDVIGYMQGHLAPVGLDADASEIVRRGLQDIGSLGDAEHFRFNWIMGGQLNSWDNAFYQYKDGVVSRERWETMLRQIRWFLAAPGFRDWWDSYSQDAHGEEFVEVIASEIKKLEPAA